MVIKKSITEKKRLSEEVYSASDLLDRFVLSSLLLSIIKKQSDYLSGFMGKQICVESVEDRDGKDDKEDRGKDEWEWYI